MEIRTSEEARTNIENFAERYINLLIEKKTIDEDIKALKQEAAEEGVPAGIVSAVIGSIKSDMKKSDAERFERETIREWLESKTTVVEKLGTLNAK